MVALTVVELSFHPGHLLCSFCCGMSVLKVCCCGKFGTEAVFNDWKLS